MTITIRTEAEIDRAASEFLAAARKWRHIALRSPMGGGKTTFTAALCRVLGVSDEVSSPTFSIINEYAGADGDPIFHFDFYRIETEAEALDLGLDEYFDSGALCLMEWPDNVAPLLPDDTLDVFINVADDGSRIISFNP